MTERAAALLEVDDLRVTYGHVEAVRGVSLRVPEGRIVTLIGPNGAGKTSILSALAGLVRPAEGTVRLAGAEKAIGEKAAAGLFVRPAA